MGNSTTPLIATETRYGYVKVATSADVAAGTNNERAVTPLKLGSFLNAYSGARTYNPPDLVSYNGGLYRCLSTTTGNAPPNATYWGDPVTMPSTDLIDPANATFSPVHSTGNGSVAIPYRVANGYTTSTGAINDLVFMMTLTGLSPGYRVTMVDQNAAANGGRFTFSNYVANSSGTLITTVLFSDSPPSAPATFYTLDMRVGTTLRVTHLHAVVAASLQNPDDVIPIAVATTAVAGKTYVLTSALDLTLPSPPSDGDWVDIANYSNVGTCRVLTGGGKLFLSADGLTTDTILNLTCVTARFRCVYDLDTDRWYIKT